MTDLTPSFQDRPLPTRDTATAAETSPVVASQEPLEQLLDGRSSDTLYWDFIDNIVCPNLMDYWRLKKVPDSTGVVLRSRDSAQQHEFSAPEGFALRYFTGKFTIAQVCQLSKRQFNQEWSSEFILQLIRHLLDLNVVSLDAADAESQPTSPWQLKADVAWILHQEGYWILRNPEDFTFMQLPFAAKAIVQALADETPEQVAQHYGLSMLELRSLMQQLAATGMFINTQPPQRPKSKFKPTQLLFFKFSLCNPDRWLTRTLPYIQGLWSRPFILSLIGFLTIFTVVGMTQSQSILHTGMQLWQALGPSVFVPFGLLAMAVVTIHELGHAYTLKQYGGTVPEVGLMFMCLMPAAYTNTTDQYALTCRRQRVWVVAAGVLCQVTIAAIALGLWNLAVPGSWLAFTSYLLMVSALFTVALNLNPLARFDGYYLLTALTGINNLRSRSFTFYRCLLLRQPTQELPEIRWILALYAPCSFLYLLLVFGQLFLWLGQWLVWHIPFLALAILLLWGIYYFWPPPPQNA